MKHELVGNTLQGYNYGIVATCTCGWKSCHITSMSAFVAFQDHKERSEAKQQEGKK